MDDVAKARVKLNQERYKEAADFWNQAVALGQQTVAGKAIQRKQMLQEKAAQTRRHALTPKAGT